MNGANKRNAFEIRLTIKNNSNSGVKQIEIGIWPSLTSDHAGDNQPV